MRQYYLLSLFLQDFCWDSIMFEQLFSCISKQKKGGKTHYTAILEKENVDIAAP